MIIYDGDRCTPNEAAKAIALRYGQSVLNLELEYILGLQYDKMTELERTKLENRIIAVLDRIDNELEFGKIIQRKAFDRELIIKKQQRKLKRKMPRSKSKK